MTIKPRVKRFRIRRSTSDQDALGRHDHSARVADTQVLGGDVDQDTPREASGGAATAEIEAIRAEGLTGRQLRMARRIAQRNGIEPESDLDAVRLLRRKGIDPFARSNILDLVVADSRGGGPVEPASLSPGAGEPTPNLPKAYRAPQLPSNEGRAPEISGSEEIRQIQQDITRRRRRRLLLLAARLCVFVLLPTLIAVYYYAAIATPLYTTQSEFVIQQAETQSAPSGMAGMFSGTALATSQDSVTVQSYLQSRDAMRRLDEDHGFKAHFSAEELDPLLRLSPDASSEEAYKLFQRMVRIGYDPSEGIIRMEVRATDPQVSQQFSRALLSYAEERVDQLTQRLREDQMSGAMESFEEAEERMRAAQERVMELQERYSVLSSEVEVSLLTTQITNLQTELTRERLALQELMANPRPNPARVDPLERRIANLESEIESLRARLTEDSAEGTSIARVSGQLTMAQADVEVRQMMLAQSLQQLESARIEANRQVRYLSLGVSPVAPDEASHPRVFENSVLAFLIFSGIYLMLSMTVSILREQVSS